MSDSSAEFVRVVKSPVGRHRDYTLELQTMDTFNDVLSSALLEESQKDRVDDYNIQREFLGVLNILKAEFSTVDAMQGFIPMRQGNNIVDIISEMERESGCPDEVWYVAQAIAHPNPHQPFRVQPFVASHDEIKQAIKRPQYFGIERAEWQRAGEALDQAQRELFKSIKNFSDYPEPASTILTSAEIKAGCNTPEGHAVFSKLFTGRPEIRRRLGELLTIKT